MAASGRRGSEVRIYYHNDYDGAASAALVAGWWQQYAPQAEEPRLQSVDYQDSFWQADLPPTGEELVALVDFQFHPRADLWFDHHPTAFSSVALAQTFVPGPRQVWRPDRVSCAEVVFEALGVGSRELVAYARKIDGALYQSVDEYYAAEHPALQVNHVWGDLTEGQKADLIRRFRSGQLELPRELEPKLERWRRKTTGLWGPCGEAAELRGSVAVVNGLSARLPFLRFATFRLYPQSAYGVTAYWRGSEIGISLARNPWAAVPLDAGPHLGLLARRFGGGGHAAAAGITLPGDEGQATRVLYAVIRELNQEEMHVAQAA